MKIRLIMLQSIIMTVWTGLSAQESNRYLVIVTSAECYSQPAAGSAEKGDPLPFGSVIFSDSVIRRDNDFDYIKTVHPRSGDTVYVPYEMTMKSRKVTVERSGDTVTLEGVSGSPYFHVPHDLVMLNPRYTLGGRAVYARKSATDDLYAMMDDAREDGHTLLIARGYDDLAKRIQVYEDAVRKDPKQTEVKKPLSSEYGSGLHFDITDSKAEDDYRHYVMDQQAWEWLDANIGEYGFERSGPHYLLVYTGKKKKTQHAKGAAFPDNIDRKVKFGSICTIHILKKSNFQYASYVWVHHNEKSGGKTMHYALDTYGGHSVYIINKNRRNLYIDYGRRHFAVDPNRIFTDKGIDLNLRKHYPGLSARTRSRIAVKAKKIRTEILNNLDWHESKYMIAFHSNRPNSEFSINEYNRRNAYLTHTNPDHNPKNLYYTTSLDDYYFFKNRNYNVVYQRTVEDDGSLSVYAAMKGLPYINIEVEEGQDDIQKEMFDLALECIRHNYRIKGF